MKWAGVACLVLCGAITEAQMQAWRSPRTLWSRATWVTPDDARAALNYGVALQASGDTNGAVVWLSRAGQLSGTHARRDEVRMLVRDRLWLFEAFGISVCQQPTVQPYC